MNVKTNANLASFSDDELIAELVYRCAPGQVMKKTGTVQMFDGTVVKMETNTHPVDFKPASK